jgi:hypothetical protein
LRTSALPPAWSWWLGGGELQLPHERTQESLLVGVDDVCQLDTAVCCFLEVWQDSVSMSAGVHDID